ncbi:MAG: glutamate-5-semialdehyde dehydrogenase [Solobacterium sp.]|nr:glutamate-5-semialdehyde dehydrogenase [Solobacterium sp.]
MFEFLETKEILKRANAEKCKPVPSEEVLDNALFAMAASLEENAGAILQANAVDMREAEGRLSEAMKDRLLLTEARIQSMAKGIREVADLPAPCGRTLNVRIREDGLRIEKKAVPFGVVAVIYESRPNVTSDVAALTLKSGNVAVLRSGSDCWLSSLAITAALQKGLEDVGLSRDRIQLVHDRSHEGAEELMKAKGQVDLLIPRGGKNLIDSVVRNAIVPVIETGTGICHVYVDESADFETALNIIENAKTSRPAVCNAAEVLLVHENIAEEFLPLVRDRLCYGEHPVELRLDEKAIGIIPGLHANEVDFDTEFLDYILAVGIVKDTDEAIAHINLHGTHHSDCIVTADESAAARFTSMVDSACVYVNASTRFTDGGEFGLGCEMGISTQKLHARGPMGLEELCTYQYVIYGEGHIR